MSKPKGGESEFRGFVVAVALILIIKFAGPSITSVLANLINPESNSATRIDTLPSKDLVDFGKLLGR